MIKILLDSEELRYFVINAKDGRILESGETENHDTWEDTFVKLNTIDVGKKPKISFNYGFYTRSSSKKLPVWTDLNYKITSIEKTKQDRDGQNY